MPAPARDRVEAVLPAVEEHFVLILMWLGNKVLDGLTAIAQLRNGEGPH